MVKVSLWTLEASKGLQMLIYFIISYICLFSTFLVVKEVHKQPEENRLFNTSLFIDRYGDTEVPLVFSVLLAPVSLPILVVFLVSFIIHKLLIVKVIKAMTKK
jgi:L-lactate permease